MPAPHSPPDDAPTHEAQNATPTKHRMPPPHSPPDDAPESPGAEQLEPGVKLAAAHVAAGPEGAFAAPARLPDEAHEPAPASPGSGPQSVSAAALALASGPGAALIRLDDPRGEDALRRVLRAFRPDGRPYAVTQVIDLKIKGLRPEIEALQRRPRGVDRDLLREALAVVSDP